MYARQLVERLACAALALALSLSASAAPGSAELGRLFFTPQQRQDLERKRAGNRAEKKTPPVRKGSISVEGKVERSSGRNAAWINDSLQYGGKTGSDAERVTVVPYAGAPGVGLKVGQTYERQSGEVRDGLDGGKITIRKSARPSQSVPAR